jgi:hypothetical protein
MHLIHKIPVCFLMVLLLPHSNAFAESNCDNIFALARNYAQSVSNDAMQYYDARSFCRFKSEKYSDQSKQDIEGQYEMFGASFAGSSASAKEIVDKACEYVDKHGSSSSDKYSFTSQLANDAGANYKTCMDIQREGVRLTLAPNDPYGTSLAIGLENSSGVTRLNFVRANNYTCVMLNDSKPQRLTDIGSISWPKNIGANSEAINLSCTRNVPVRDNLENQNVPLASVELSIAGKPRMVSFGSWDWIKKDSANELRSQMARLNERLEQGLKNSDQNDTQLSKKINATTIALNDYINQLGDPREKMLTCTVLAAGNWNSTFIVPHNSHSNLCELIRQKIGGVEAYRGCILPPGRGGTLVYVGEPGCNWD